MADINEKLLQHLESIGDVDSLDFSSLIKEQHTKVIGAVKSLQALGEVITVEPQTNKAWELTEEGKEVVAKGSHEVQIYNSVPSEGILLSTLKQNMPDKKMGNVGFNKAMMAEWILVEKVNDVPVVRKKAQEVIDTVQDHLRRISLNDAEDIPSTQKQEYRKRKLLQEVNVNSYLVGKGIAFSTNICKIANDLTAEMLATGSWKKEVFKDYNLNAMGTPPESGHLHPLLKVRTQIRQIFLEMGFTEMPTNNYIESSFWNFDALFQPQQHPARDAHDTFFISEPAASSEFPRDYLGRVQTVHEKGGYGSQGYGYEWKEEEAQKNLLRTHTTSVSARMLYALAQKGFHPVKYFSIDRVFRNESLDATHLAEFQQVEGVVADYNLTLGDLIGIFYEFFRKLGMNQLHFKPAYNPYTEPSMEIFSYHSGLGKWIEVGNSGIFRPEMLLPMGLPSNVNVIAWGLSLERPTMIKYGLNNIRDLVGPRVDLQMVYDNPICRLDKGGTSLEDVIEVMTHRWDTILSELETLRSEVKSLRKDNIAREDDKVNLVVFADPQHPPHSVLLLTRLLSNRYSVASSVHVHSSIPTLPTFLEPFSIATDSGNSLNANVIFTLIWKKIGVDPILVESPLSQNQVVGEVNIARYLTRLLERRDDMQVTYESKGVVAAGCVDDWLDQIYLMLTRGNNKQRSDFFRKINLHLSSHQWLVGSSVSLADVGLWSALKQKLVSNSVPFQVNKWYEMCSNYPLFVSSAAKESS